MGLNSLKRTAELSSREKSTGRCELCCKPGPRWQNLVKHVANKKSIKKWNTHIF